MARKRAGRYRGGPGGRGTNVGVRAIWVGIAGGGVDLTSVGSKRGVMAIGTPNGVGLSVGVGVSLGVGVIVGVGVTRVQMLRGVWCARCSASLSAGAYRELRSSGPTQARPSCRRTSP